MKLQLLALFVAATAFSETASAAHYYNADHKIESKLCSISANEGFTAARKVAAQHGVYLSRYSKSILCNGDDIRDIAKKVDDEVRQEKVIEVFAKNSHVETQLCMTALKQGLAPVKEKIANLNSLKCNGEVVTEFVKRYQGATI
ncbi:exonuclease III [Pseudoalteromonas ostreae]|uniref:exonuclease III n=1 Tax=Pseudoalteromonas ostreae TaxID=2774154 RepID=UPI001B39CCEA|nr:exonuclease III [Pseudoalteromonas ostreae]